MALGTSTLLACRPSSPSPAQRGRFFPHADAMRSGEPLGFPPRFVGSARTSKKPRKSAATKNGVTGLSGRPPRRSPCAQGRSTDARAPSAASACPEQSARSAPLGAKTRIPATGFLTTLAFRQNPGRRRGRGRRSRKRKRDAAAASAQAPRPGPAPRIPLRPLRHRRARRALRARRVRGARCGATQAGLFWDWES